MTTNKETGKKALILGIDDENVRRLKADQPIQIKGAELGLDHDIMIIHGRTRATLVAMLKPMTTGDTKYHIGKGKTE